MKNLKIVKLCVCLIALFGLLSCSSTAFKTDYETSFGFPAKSISAATEAFEKGAATRGIRVEKKSKSQYNVYITVRKHTVHAFATISKEGISYRYVSSANMKYNGKNIHKKYYTWLANLTASTRSYL